MGEIDAFGSEGFVDQEMLSLRYPVGTLVHLIFTFCGMLLATTTVNDDTYLSHVAPPSFEYSNAALAGLETISTEYASAGIQTA